VSETSAAGGQASRPKALLFDLLTCLLNSWEIWERAAGNAVAGRAWRVATTQRMVRQPEYVDYRTLVEEGRREVGLPPGSAGRLFRLWPQMRPWPDVPPFLERLSIPFAVVTNCSESLAMVATTCLRRPPHAVISAERAGVYKPDPRLYTAALDALKMRAEDVIYAAGSAYDARGAHAFGLPTRWIDRDGSADDLPVIRYATLIPLAAVLDQRSLTGLVQE
jgi:2-haloacid dehalogenase